MEAMTMEEIMHVAPKPKPSNFPVQNKYGKKITEDIVQLTNEEYQKLLEERQFDLWKCFIWGNEKYGYSIIQM